MKREIKFRVWHKVEKRYLPLSEGTGSDHRVLTIDAGIGIVSMFNVYGLERPVNYLSVDVVIEQFTGLKDKNGKDIYEGDTDGIGYVTCSDGAFWYDLIGGNEVFHLHDVAHSIIIETNIHDNPQLLK